MPCISLDLGVVGEEVEDFGWMWEGKYRRGAGRKNLEAFPSGETKAKGVSVEMKFDGGDFFGLTMAKLGVVFFLFLLEDR